MAADASLKVQVTTTSDTSGIDQVTESTKRLTDEQRNFQAVANRTGETLAQVQARFTQTATSAQQTAATIKDLGGVTQIASQASTLLGAAIGAAIPVTIAGAIHGIITAVKAFEAEEQRVFDEMERGIEKVRALQQSILAVQDAQIETAIRSAVPFSQALQRIEQDSIRLREEMSLLNLSIKEEAEEWEKDNQKLKDNASARERILGLQRQQQAFMDKEAVTRAQALGTEPEIFKAEWGRRYNAELEARKKLQLDTSAASVNEAVFLQFRAEEQNKIRAEAERETGTRKETTSILRETQTVLEGIRQQQALIAGAPFMGADEKSAATLRSTLSEMRELQRVVADLQRQKGGVTDPAQLDQINAKIQVTQFRFQQLGQQVQALQAPLRTELSQWAASFGTTAQQIGKTIEQTIGAALSQVNQFLITGKFNAQALLQQLVLLGLQLVEQMIIQRIMAAINAAASAGQAAATGPLVAAAWAPAATAATIATQGASAAQAPAAVAASLASIMAILVVAHEGGMMRRRRRFHDGGLADDEVPIIAQEGEIMMRRSVADKYGDFLLALNAGNFQHGGMITASGGDPRGGAYPVIPLFEKPGGIYYQPLYQGTAEPAFLRGLNPFQGPSVLTPTQAAVAASEAGVSLSALYGGGVTPGYRYITSPGDAWVGMTTDATGAGLEPPMKLPARTVYGGNYPVGTVSGSEFSSVYGGYVPSAAGFTGFSSFSGPSLYPTSYVNYGGNIGFVPHAQPVGFSTGYGMSGAGFGASSFGGASGLGTGFAVSSSGAWGGFGGFGSLGFGAFGTAAGPGGGPQPTKFYHYGGRIRRMHNGGVVGGGSNGTGSGPGIHIYAFTDLKAMTRHMASRDGQKIIFDTVKGRRIDLGMR